LIPDIALRLKLTLQQAAGSGLTLYVIIGRAYTKYENFPWGRANTLTGGELVSWETARQILSVKTCIMGSREIWCSKINLV